MECACQLESTILDPESDQAAPQKRLYYGLGAYRTDARATTDSAKRPAAVPGAVASDGARGELSTGDDARLADDLRASERKIADNRRDPHWGATAANDGTIHDCSDKCPLRAAHLHLARLVAREASATQEQLKALVVAHTRAYSSRTLARVDGEVHVIVEAQYAKELFQKKLPFRETASDDWIHDLAEYFGKHFQRRPPIWSMRVSVRAGARNETEHENRMLAPELPLAVPHLRRFVVRAQWKPVLPDAWARKLPALRRLLVRNPRLHQFAARLMPAPAPAPVPAPVPAPHLNKQPLQVFGEKLDSIVGEHPA